MIDLCAALFDWARFQATKGAVKLHLLLDHDGYLPSYAVISEGKVHEIRLARQLRLPRGSMVVFDRGYTDYDWFAELTQQGVHFVTRLKDNAGYEVVEARPGNKCGAVLSDQIIVFRQQATADNERFFRIVRYWDADNQREFTFLTNHYDLSA